MLAVRQSDETPQRLRLVEVNDRPLIGDNPPDHDVLITLVAQMSAYISNNNATLRRIEDKAEASLGIANEALEIARATERNVAIQNGGVKQALSLLAIHDEHHGKGDIHIAERLTGLDVADHLHGHEGRLTALETPAHDAQVRRTQLAQQIALVMAGAAAVPVLYGAYVVIAGLFG
jgi:hypothetical protein